MKVTIPLSPEVERSLRVQAAREGRTLEEYLVRLYEREAQKIEPSNGQPTPEDLAEFDRQLDELSADVPTLPADFSRADIYGEHD